MSMSTRSIQSRIISRSRVDPHAYPLYKKPYCFDANCLSYLAYIYLKPFKFWLIIPLCLEAPFLENLYMHVDKLSLPTKMQPNR